MSDNTTQEIPGLKSVTVKLTYETNSCFRSDTTYSTRGTTASPALVVADAAYELARIAAISGFGDRVFANVEAARVAVARDLNQPPIQTVSHLQGELANMDLQARNWHAAFDRQSEALLNAQQHLEAAKLALRTCRGLLEAKEEHGYYDRKILAEVNAALGDSTSERSEFETIRQLLAVVRAVDVEFDDYGVRCMVDGMPSFALPEDAVERIEATLNALDVLPDDKPGVTLGVAGKAEWALRNLLGAQP